MPQHFPENKVSSSIQVSSRHQSIYVLKHWEARLKIEKSKAVKSPSIGHQLVGSKAIQEEMRRRSEKKR